MRIQEGSTSLMIHDVYEQLAYGSNIITLRPGYVIATGTPAGVIGTLVNSVVAETVSSR